MREQMEIGSRTRGAGQDTGCWAGRSPRLPEPGRARSPRLGKRIPERAGAEQSGSAGGRRAFNLCSNESWASSAVWGLVVPVAGAIPALRAVFAFALMPRSEHRSHTTRMHFCVPRCPLIREYYLFLERLITLQEWISVPISSWLHLFCLSCFDPLQCFDPSFLPSLDGMGRKRNTLAGTQACP